MGDGVGGAVIVGRTGEKIRLAMSKGDQGVLRGSLIDGLKSVGGSESGLGVRMVDFAGMSVGMYRGVIRLLDCGVGSLDG